MSNLVIAKIEKETTTSIFDLLTSFSEKKVYLNSQLFYISKCV